MFEFDSGSNVGAQLDDLESGTSSPASSVATNRPKHSHPNTTPTRSFKNGIRKGSGLKSVLKFGVLRHVFPEDLIVSEKKILDPQNKFLLKWNKFFVVSCILAASIDALFFYLPVFDKTKTCLGIDRKLAIIATTLRTVVDAFYLIHMALKFRTAYIAPSSRVFGRGELVIDPAQIAKRYLKWYFIIDFLSVLPLPQIVIWRYLLRGNGSDVMATKEALLYIVLVQYIPRFARFVPLTSELNRTAGVLAENSWDGAAVAAYYLFLYMLASHIVGAFWYILSAERADTCWKKACRASNHTTELLYCGNENMPGYASWISNSTAILNESCAPGGDNPPFDFGIFDQALSSGIVFSTKFVQKYCYCLWWGLQNLSTLGQGLKTSTLPGETIFSVALAIFGLILFALLISNMQTHLQRVISQSTIWLEEMRIKRQKSEQWMHHRFLPEDLRDRVRRYDQYKWLTTRGVDEENLVQTLPKDLRRDIKRHLCLDLVRRVPLFRTMDDRLLDAICERLKPCLYTDSSYIVREGEPVDEMLFILRGRLESTSTDGGRIGIFNQSLLKEGDFCGEELLTWACDPKCGANLPLSTRTVRALREVEAFALLADDLKFVASQYRRLYSRQQVQRTFRRRRFWRYSKRKILEQRQKEEEEEAV